MPQNYDIITSAANPLVKTLRSLDRKKGRAETGLFQAEGARLVEQGLANGWHLDTLIMAVPALERPFLADLAERAEQTGARITLVPEHLLRRLVRRNNPQAVLGLFQQKARSLDTLAAADHPIWLGLYEVRDPGNLGTILRTADCAGLGGVILVESCCDPYSVEAVRASMGSVFDVPFAEASLSETLSWSTQHGRTVVAASMNGTVRHDGPVYGDRALILMGNEQSGLPQDVETRCDQLVRIPMRGGADSLNLAQATAILTYEAWRQRDFA